ncbi:MAG TPA: DUF4468 domain-containing protein [Mucilaginibacter sp.]|jgi:hypothetical protein|nr:DUF4468 domain-containing protein [Mucilaginibacter sp.]
MKTLLVGLVCILFAKITFAQQDLLSFDEHNKYIYYQVVNMPGLAVDTLHERGAYFLKTAYPKTAVKALNADALMGEGKFITYGGISVMKHEKGEMAYQVNIEFKDQKYRFWLTNFVFTPYQRDRYGNFVPQLGVEIPLETASTRLEKKELDGYLDETGAFCKQWGDKLKIYMLKVPAQKKEEPVKKVVTDKW